MEQSPLINIPAKSTDDVDFSYGIKSTIANVYGEDPTNYSEPVNALNRYRQDATRGATTDNTGRDLLQSYYGQLEMLELRFPELRVMFTWRDIFGGGEISQHSLAYEKASILFNLASTYSVIGSNSNRADTEGIKRAFFNLRAAAGLWDYIANNFLHAPSSDLSRDIVRFLSSLMLAQAQEVFLEKTIEEKVRNGSFEGKSLGIVSKLSSQCSFQYNSLLDTVRDNVNKGVFERHWASVIHIKSKYFTSQSQYFRSIIDKASDKHGESIARIQIAESLAKESYRLSATFNTFFAPCDTLPSDVSSILVNICKSHMTKCTEYKNEIVKENDLIFHEPIPAENAISTIDKLNAANIVNITEIYANPEVQKNIGSDLFSNLVPFSVHEAASIYSEEKAKIVRRVTESIELSNGELEASIEYLGLPKSLNKFINPSSFHNIAKISNEVKELCNVLKQHEKKSSLKSQISSIEVMKNRIRNDLNWITNELDSESKDCEQARMKYTNFNQTPSARNTKEFRQDLKNHSDTIDKVQASDDSIKRVHDYIQDDIRVLVDSADDDDDDDDNELSFIIKDYVLNSSTKSHSRQESLLDVDVNSEEIDNGQNQLMQTKSKEIYQILEQLKNIKLERGKRLQMLRQKIQNDDVSHLLILNRKAQQVESQMFDTELEKFKEDQIGIDKLINEQKKRLADLNKSWIDLTSSDKAKELHNKWSQSEKKQKDIMKRFKKAGDSYFEIFDGVNQATTFYTQLQDIVESLKSKVTSYVQVRSKERIQAIIEAESQNNSSTGGGDSPFENEFGRLNLQPMRPPKPEMSSPSPTANAYQQPSNIYSQLPPPPPKPQPSVYQSMYGQQGLQSPPPPPKPTTYSQYPYMSSPTSNLQQQQQPNLPYYQSPPPQNYYNYR